MYPLNQLKSLASCGRDPARSLPFRRGFLLIPLILGAFTLTQVQAAVDTPDPGPVPPNGQTADGQGALSGSTGFYNSAFGFLALISNGASSFNTGLGAGTLLLNTAIEQTAVGAGTLLNNTTGLNNTGCGAFALFTSSTGSFNNAVGANSLVLNTTGDSNNALGESALFSNDTGAANTAVGDVAAASGFGDDFSLNTAVGAGALFSGGTDGTDTANSNNAVGALALGGAGPTPPPNIGVANNAFGVEALEAITSGSGNTAVGDTAGVALEDGSFNIYVGFLAGSASAPGENATIRIGEPGFVDAAFVQGISGVPVSGAAVCVDGNGQLGECAPTSPMSANGLLKQQGVVQELKATTERQAAVIALQEGQIKALTAGLKQQAEQIQKVSAQLEMVRPTPRVVENR
jgi:hypothetical protein